MDSIEGDVRLLAQRVDNLEQTDESLRQEVRSLATHVHQLRDRLWLLALAALGGGALGSGVASQVASQVAQTGGP